MFWFVSCSSSPWYDLRGWLGVKQLLSIYLSCSSHHCFRFFFFFYILPVHLDSYHNLLFIFVILCGFIFRFLPPVHFHCVRSEYRCNPQFNPPFLLSSFNPYPERAISGFAIPIRHTQQWTFLTVLTSFSWVWCRYITTPCVNMDRSEDDGIPSELKERLGTFDAAVSSLESMLQPLLSTSYTDLVEKVTHFYTSQFDFRSQKSTNLVNILKLFTLNRMFRIAFVESWACYIGLVRTLGRCRQLRHVY